MLTNPSERLIHDILIPAIENLGGTVPQQATVANFEDYQFDLLKHFVSALINAVKVPTPAEIAAEPAGSVAAHAAIGAPHVGHASTAALVAHTSATNNPHGVTAAQIGAELFGTMSAHLGSADPHPQYATDGELSAHATASAPHAGHATAAALTAHTSATNNPHQVTASQVGAESTGAVATHAAVATATHGLPAGASVLGTKMGSGRYTQGGQATATGALGALAIAQYRDVAVVFPLAFTAAPRVFVSGATGYPCAALNITATGFTARVFGELSLAATHVINYLAIGA